MNTMELTPEKILGKWCALEVEPGNGPLKPPPTWDLEPDSCCAGHILTQQARTHGCSLLPNSFQGEKLKFYTSKKGG